MAIDQRARDNSLASIASRKPVDVDGFVIHCSTCRTRLAIRNTSAIGQIHPCPKCGGMVLIQAPSRPSTELPANAETLLPKTLVPSVSGLLASASRSFEQIDSLLDVQEQAFAPKELAENPGESRAHVTDDDGRGMENSPSIHKVSARNASRKVFWASVGGIAGSLMAVCLIGPLVVASRLARDAQSLPVVIPPTTAIAPHVRRRSRAEHRVAKIPIRPLELADVTQAAVPDEPNMESPADDGAKLTAESEQEFRDKIAEDENTEPDADQKLESRAPDRIAFEVDPRIFALPEPHPSAKVELTPAGVAPQVGDRMRQPLERIELPQARLGEFCRLIEQMSGVMISIDPSALEMARLGPEAELELSSSAADLGSTFSRGLRPLYLGYRVHGAHLIVQHLAVLHGHPPKLELAVGDLLSQGWAERQLVNTIQEAVEPELWARQPSESLEIHSGELLVREPPWIQYQILDLLERLRLARDLPTRTAYGPQIAKQTRSVDRGRAQLERQVFVHGGQGITLLEWIKELELQADCHFLPDWFALDSAGITKHTTLRFGVDSMPLADALSAILSPLGLTYRALRDDTFWITTRQREGQTFVMEIHDLRSLLNRTASGPQEIVAGIQAAFVSSLGQDGQEFDPIQSRLVLDPDETLLIARLPQSQQIRLGRGLDRLVSQDGSLAAVERFFDARTAWSAGVFVEWPAHGLGGRSSR